MTSASRPPSAPGLTDSDQGVAGERPQDRGHRSGPSQSQGCDPFEPRGGGDGGGGRTETQGLGGGDRVGLREEEGLGRPSPRKGPLPTGDSVPSHAGGVRRAVPTLSPRHVVSVGGLLGGCRGAVVVRT